MAKTPTSAARHTQNLIEYYAEGVETWFEAGPESSPADGTYNEVNTRAELSGYDPTLAALVAGDDARRRLAPELPLRRRTDCEAAPGSGG